MSSPDPTEGDSEATTDSFVNISEYEDKEQHQEAPCDHSRGTTSPETTEKRQGPTGQEREKPPNEAKDQESRELPQENEEPTQRATSHEGADQSRVSTNEEGTEKPQKATGQEQHKEPPPEPMSQEGEKQTQVGTYRGHEEQTHKSTAQENQEQPPEPMGQPREEQENAEQPQEVQESAEQESAEQPREEQENAEQPQEVQESAEQESAEQPREVQESAEQESAEQESAEQPREVQESTEQESEEQESAEQESAEQPREVQGSAELESVEQPREVQGSAELESAEQPREVQGSAEQKSAEQPREEQESAEQPREVQGSAEQPQEVQGSAEQPWEEQESAEQENVPQSQGEQESAEQESAEQPREVQESTEQKSAEQPREELESVEQPREVQESAEQKSAEQPREELESAEQPREELESAEQPREVQESAEQESAEQPREVQGSVEQESAEQPPEVQGSVEQESAEQPPEVQKSTEQKSAEQPREELESAEQPREELESAEQPREVQESAEQESAEQPREVQGSAEQESAEQPREVQGSAELESGEQPREEQESAEQENAEQSRDEQESAEQPREEQESAEQPREEQESAPQPQIESTAQEGNGDPHRAAGSRGECEKSDHEVQAGWSCSLAPADQLWTVRRDGAVRLRLGAPDLLSFPPLTVPQLFAQSVSGRGQQVALRVRRADEWHKITYLQYEEQAVMVAKALLQLGLQRFHGVLILGSNSPEWFMAEIGSILAGGLAVCMDLSCTASFCQKVAQSCEAHVVFAQDQRQLRKILQVWNELPMLKAIVQWEGDVDAPHPGVYMWSEFMALGSEVTRCTLNGVMQSQKANQCCAVIYTGGATDAPRGVLLSHDNVTWMARSFCKALHLGSEDVVVSYLPLNNISAQMSDLWVPLCCGGTTYFTEPYALKRSLLSTLRLARPTRFLGFPRLWEKIQRRWKLLERTGSRLHRRLISWARGVGLRTSYQGKTRCLLLRNVLAEHLVFHRARAAIGLDRCTHCYVGETPITQDIMQYFQSLGLNLLPWYGMNESCGAHSLAQPRTWQRDSFGREIPGCRSRVELSPGQDSGALCLWGRHIFMGYLGMKEETEEALDKDGWLRSGALGRLDTDGLLYLTSRGQGASMSPAVM